MKHWCNGTAIEWDSWLCPCEGWLNIWRPRRTSASNHQFTMFKLSRTLRTTLAQPVRSLSTTPTQSNTKKVLGHSADNYFKDVDINPPDDPSIHRVDSSSDSSQKPYEPPSGKWSLAGIKTKEYEDSATKTGTVEGKVERHGDKRMKWNIRVRSTLMTMWKSGLTFENISIIKKKEYVEITNMKNVQHLSIIGS